jgi:hypothetical protein
MWMTGSKIASGRVPVPNRVVEVPLPHAGPGGPSPERLLWRRAELDWTSNFRARR